MAADLKGVVPFLLLLSVLSCQPSQKRLNSGETAEVYLSIPGESGHIFKSRLLISIPSGINQTHPLPLLVALHGYGSNAAAFHDLWKPVCNSLGFILLTPQGEDTVQGGFGYGWGDHSEKIFLTAVQWISEKVFVYPKQVFLSGFSQGGSLCYKIGLKHPDKIRGIAPLGAHFDPGWLPEDTTGLQNMSLYIGHGALEANLESTKKVFDRLSSICSEAKLEVYENVGHCLPEDRDTVLMDILKFFKISEETR